jgi:hypothetical protein
MDKSQRRVFGAGFFYRLNSNFRELLTILPPLQERTMTPFVNASQPRSAIPPATAQPDGPVEGALLPLVRINGKLIVIENCLHFFRPPRHGHPKPAVNGGCHE